MANHCYRAGNIGYMFEFPDFKAPQFQIESYNQRFHEANVIIDAGASNVFYPDHWGGLSVKCAFNGSEHYRTSRTHYRVDHSSFLVFNEGTLYSSWIEDQHHVESFTLNMTPAFEREATAALLGSQASMIDDPSNNGNNHLHFLECLYRHGGDITRHMMQMRSLAKDLAHNHLRLEEMFFGLFEKMNELQADHFRQNDEAFRPPVATELYQRLLHARDYIWSCYDQELTLTDISEVACLNKFHFLRQFKKFFRLTPHQFLTQVRMKAACEKLAHTADPISLITSETGYSDLASFGKLFKRTTGFSPARYREDFAKIVTTSPNLKVAQ
ncbi:MAG TPA: AraC family transcriptional regulator [Cyclobacteriaceae bacterium]|nr:AraC family transcriptional regulator [Cyclobacteriaceae bacterium]